MNKNVNKKTSHETGPSYDKCYVRAKYQYNWREDEINAGVGSDILHYRGPVGRSGGARVYGKIRLHK